MNGKNRSSFFVITVFALCSACSNGKGKETASAATVAVVREDRAPVYAESEGVVAEQNEFVSVEAYPVADSCAGPFRIGDGIPEKIEGFTVTESREEKTLPNGETREIPVYTYEIGNEGWVKVTPQYDATTGCANDRIGEIFVYSDLFLTDRGIGAMSSLEEFAAAYPDFGIRYADGVFVVETPRLRHVRFLLQGECYIGAVRNSTSIGCTELKVSDFKEKSCFTAIRISR